MHAVFRKYIESLEPSFQKLIQMKSATVAKLPPEIPQAGIYLFSEKGKNLYVGRSNAIKKRLKNHCYPSSGHNSATFAFKLAREKTAIKGTRQELERNPKFSPIFIKQKQRVKNMSVQFVSEDDPINQALLEMYVAISLETPYNDFDNH